MNLAPDDTVVSVSGLHLWTHHTAGMIGFEIGEHAPQWLHLAMHFVLVTAPLTMFLAIGYLLLRFTSRYVRNRFRAGLRRMTWRDLRSVLWLRWQEQAMVVALGLLAQPILYASLELPKRIVNGAIESGHFPIEAFGLQFSQLGLLAGLSSLYLCAILLGGIVKYRINMKKGEIGEHTLLHLRLALYREWRRTPRNERRADVIPMATSEIEPIGGFAGDVLATPVFQGGTMATVLLFMFVQDPILGAAAMTLVPLQLCIVPMLQAKVNERMSRRIVAVRSYGDILGEQMADHQSRHAGRRTRSIMHDLRKTRLELQRAKFLQKTISNFLMALTPFLLYSIGGWLVIEGRLSLGALVAVIASFKDFSAPFRELILYYQNLSDVFLRSAQYANFLRKCSARGDTGSTFEIDACQRSRPLRAAT